MTQTEIWNKANKKIFELYGKNPDLRIVNRFLSEKSALEHFGVAGYFEELAEICRESIEKYNERLIVKNVVTSNFTAYLLGASSINPLPPHYYCKTCKHIEWSEENACLFDMESTRKCICGAEMHANGYGLEWELYLPYVKKSNEKKENSSGNRYHDLFESILSTHFQKNLLEATQACHLLGQATGVSPEEICFDDNEVKSRLLFSNFSCLPPKTAVFLKETYTVVQPNSYDELLKLISFAHGTYAWKNNAEELLKNGKCKLAKIPATRDEVFVMIRDAMQERGVYDTGFALEVSYKTYHGYYREYGMDEYTASTLKNLGFGDWFTKYIANVYYMAPKALAVLELRLFIALTYYKTYYPEQFTAVLDKENIW